MKKIIFLLTAGSLVIACDKTEVAEVIDPNTYPIATFEMEDPNQQGAIFEEATGGTIAIDVTLDRPVARNTEFTAYPTENNMAVPEEEFEVSNAVISGSTTTGQINISILGDDFPEPDETVELMVKSVEGTDGESYDMLLNPATEPLILTFTIANSNSDQALTVGLKWNEEQAVDIDMALMDSTGAELALQATGNNPEINEFIPNTAPDGTYYVSIQPYEIITPQFEYTFGISAPNGEITTFEGVFDTENLAAYTADSSQLGEVYRLVKIVKAGTNYTLTQLP